MKRIKKETELSLQTLKFSLRLLPVSKQRLNHMILTASQLRAAHTVGFTIQNVLYNARQRTVISGFVMGRALTSLEATFSGTW